MSFLNNVIRDLVEKRLWPVAIALIAALVAVPIVLGGKSDTSTPSADVASATAANVAPTSSNAEVVSLEEQAAGKVQRAGKVRNPFIQHHQPKPTSTAAAETTAPSVTAPSGGSSGTTGGDSTAGNGSPGTTTPATGGAPVKTPAPSKYTYRVKFSFGEAGAQKSYENVARLTPLPSADNPFFVYLGLQADQKHVVFLISADAEVEGDASCLPSKDDCQQIVLEAGDTEFLQLQSGTAGVVEYQLDLTSITKVKASTKASAAKAHTRESKAGRDYIRQLVADDPDALSAWTFSKGSGLLVQQDSATTPDVANVPENLAGAVTGQPVQQTATVLTVPSTTTP
jgi:hypothetical protein